MDALTLQKLTWEQVLNQSKMLDEEWNVRMMVDAKINSELINTNIHTEQKELRVYSASHVCTDNSTSTPLAENWEFNWDFQDTLNYAEIIISISTDQNSAENGLVISRSADWISVDETDEFSILANHGKTFSFPANRRYLKVDFTNGAVAQTKLNISTILKVNSSKWSSHKIWDEIVWQDDSILVKSVISAEDESWNFVNIRSTEWKRWNNLRVSLDQTEETTNSIQTIDYSHAELHEWNRFYSRGTEQLSSGATKNLLIVTPNTARWAHMTFEASGENGEIEVWVYEWVTTSNDWTRDNERNRNRNFPDNNTTFVYVWAVITNNGVLLSQQTAGSGKNTGWSNRDNQEVLLKQNTKYLFYIKNNTVSNNKINRTLDWYEHTNLN